MKKCLTCQRVYPVEYNVCPVDGAPLKWSDAAGSLASSQPTYYAPPTYAVQQQPRKGLPAWAWVLIAFGAFFVVLPILMLIAIPTVGSLKKKANDLSAVQSIHTIMNAESMYEANYPSHGFACSLTALGGDPKSGAPSLTSAQMIQPDLASGAKSGYIFTISNCTKVNLGGTDRITSYTLMAVPLTAGQTGDRGFCADQSGIIKFDSAGGANCTQTLGQ